MGSKGTANAVACQVEGLVSAGGALQHIYNAVKYVVKAAAGGTLSEASMEAIAH